MVVRDDEGQEGNGLINNELSISIAHNHTTNTECLAGLDIPEADKIAIAQRFNSRDKIGFFIIANPLKPYEETIVVLPADYREDFTYQDYVNRGWFSSVQLFGHPNRH